MTKSGGIYFWRVGPVGGSFYMHCGASRHGRCSNDRLLPDGIWHWLGRCMGN